MALNSFCPCSEDARTDSRCRASFPWLHIPYCNTCCLSSDKNRLDARTSYQSGIPVFFSLSSDVVCIDALRLSHNRISHDECLFTLAQFTMVSSRALLFTILLKRAIADSNGNSPSATLRPSDAFKETQSEIFRSVLSSPSVFGRVNTRSALKHQSSQPTDQTPDVWRKCGQPHNARREI